MNEPDNKVLSPETPLNATRGRTTQKRVSAAAKASAALVNSTLTSTCDRSRLSVTALTSPISTSLYLTLVLPGSMPSAVLKVMVMVGPVCNSACTTSDNPTSAATIGI